jgi:hypothetical protein
MARELTLRHHRAAAAGVDFALQKGSPGKDLIFEFQPSIRAGVSDSMAAMGGPILQGPPRRRFIYVDIGTYAGQADSC